LTYNPVKYQNRFNGAGKIERFAKVSKRSFYESVAFNFSVKDRGHTETLVDEACLIGFTGLPRQFADSCY